MAIQLNFKARYIIIFLVSSQCCPLAIVQTLMITLPKHAAALGEIIEFFFVLCVESC